MLPEIIVFLFLAVILYNLGAGLYYMLRDQGKTNRTVRALTWRVGLSILLFGLLILGKVLGLFPEPADPITGQPRTQQEGS